MSDSYDDYEAKIQLAEHAWEKRVVKTEHDRAVELGQAYERGWNAALAQQEPVAWLSTDCIGERYLCFTKPKDNDPVQPLYTTPPKREWVGLTDEEIQKVVSKKWWDWEDAFDIEGFSRAIEAKLKEKNGGEYRNGATTERTRLKEKNQ
jgi:hypothetical protein